MNLSKNKMTKKKDTAGSFFVSSNANDKTYYTKKNKNLQDFFILDLSKKIVVVNG